MAKELLMGNAAIALGAIRAGVGLVAGYPGTPSTEVLETIAKHGADGIYVEWSVNEKAALEVGAGAAHCGKRVLVTMKQVGLNVAGDPLMSLAYIGVKGGMVVLVADDPGPISSQTEQDTRSFAQYSKLPIFDPSSPEEAYFMIEEAFAYSEKYSTPVLFRPTTRVCHACAVVDTQKAVVTNRDGEFARDPKLVIFPRLSYAAHLNIEKRNPEIGRDFSSYHRNVLRKGGRLGVATGGISYAYLSEVLPKDTALLKIATAFPFPEDLAVDFLSGLDEVLVIEELDPVIERALLQLAGKNGINISIIGKLTGHVQAAGENTPESVKKQISEFLSIPVMESDCHKLPELPMRPPVLCAGCPHRASFYAVKQAMKGEQAVFCGDIGCYTLGNAMPINMVDTCLCMGAGVTMAQGIARSVPSVKTFAFIGDSTFFHTGIPGIVNAIYNQTDFTLVVLDNSTTAMTGHQPHPGTGRTMMGEIVEKLSIEEVLKGLGVKSIKIVDPLNLEEAVAAAADCKNISGVSAIIYRSPCIAVVKNKRSLAVDAEKCTGCKKCARELGCPALIKNGGKIAIDSSMCTACGLCTKICGFNAIKKAEEAASKPAVIEPDATIAEDEKKPLKELNCLLCGVGGQGTVLASKLLAKCAMNRDLFVRTAETIGMAQRGGSVVSHVRIGAPGISPLIPMKKADLIIAFEPGEAVRCLPYLKPEGSVVLSTAAIKPVTDTLSKSEYSGQAMVDFLKQSVKSLYMVDGAEICRSIGAQKVLNMVLLGAAASSGALGFTTAELLKAAEEIIPHKYISINRQALSAGKI